MSLSQKHDKTAWLAAGGNVPNKTSQKCHFKASRATTCSYRNGHLCHHVHVLEGAISENFFQRERCADMGSNQTSDECSASSKYHRSSR